MPQDCKDLQSVPPVLYIMIYNLHILCKIWWTSLRHRVQAHIYGKVVVKSAFKGPFAKAPATWFNWSSCVGETLKELVAQWVGFEPKRKEYHFTLEIKVLKKQCKDSQDWCRGSNDQESDEEAPSPMMNRGNASLQCIPTVHRQWTGSGKWL